LRLRSPKNDLHVLVFAPVTKQPVKKDPNNNIRCIINIRLSLLITLTTTTTSHMNKRINLHHKIMPAHSFIRGNKVKVAVVAVQLLIWE
jgi:hypothetical protein